MLVLARRAVGPAALAQFQFAQLEVLLEVPPLGLSRLAILGLGPDCPPPVQKRPVRPDTLLIEDRLRRRRISELSEWVRTSSVGELGDNGEEPVEVSGEARAGRFRATGKLLVVWDQPQECVNCLPLVGWVLGIRGKYTGPHSQGSQFFVGDTPQRLPVQQGADVLVRGAERGPGRPGRGSPWLGPRRSRARPATVSRPDAERPARGGRLPSTRSTRPRRSRGARAGQPPGARPRRASVAAAGDGRAPER